MGMWVITDDLNDDRSRTKSEVGTRSIDCPRYWEEVANHPDGVKFRMRNELGRIVFQGVYVGDLCDEELLLEPLCLVGTPKGQCVQIAYEMRPQQWEVI